MEGFKKTHLVDIAKIDGGEVFDSVCYLVEHFILQHAVLENSQIMMKERERSL